MTNIGTTIEVIEVEPVVNSVPAPRTRTCTRACSREVSQLRLDLGGAPDFAQPVVGWRIWWARPSTVSTETEAGR